jgi:Co/Zn/Cd efflux system component
MIALLIGYEAVTRLIWPVVIHFNEAIPIAVLGLAVNVASVLLLGGGHDHSHGHSDAAGHEHDHEEAHYLQTRAGPVTLEIFENGVPPRFRLSCAGKDLFAGDVTIETTRPDGARQIFAMTARGGYLESADDIPEPHAFMVQMSLDRGADIHEVEFVEHEHAHGAAQRSATTICVPPLCTSWRMQPSPHWLSLVCCSDACSAGLGWTPLSACLARSLLPRGLTRLCAIPVASCST